VFKVGDKVSYPLYGAGIIEAIECKCIDGKNSDYYVLGIPIGNLTITISVAKAEALGLRYIHDANEVVDIINNADTIDMSANWAQRYKDNMDILRTGDLFKIVQVFKTLILRERIRVLSSVEKKLLGTTKQIILTEIILSNNIDKKTAELMLVGSMSQTA
jgi:CarD family transcriptional regulator